MVRVHSISKSVSCYQADVYVGGYDRYVVAVGWDRRVNVYIDSVDDLRQIQEPQSQWPDDIVSFASFSVKNVCCSRVCVFGT